MRLRRLLRRSYQRIRRKIRRTGLIKTSTFFGCPLWGIPGETVTESIVGSGAFEAFNARLMLEFASEGMTIIDVGAHIGFFSALGSWIAGSNGQVHAFEPTPSTFAILQKNVEFMRRYCPVVVPNMSAVGSHVGSAALLVCESNMSSRNTLAVLPRLADKSRMARLLTNQCEVPIVTLDEYCHKNVLEPGYIKIDAESYEMEVIKGACWVISSFRPILSIEVGDCDIPDVPKSSETVAWIMKNGYVPYECNQGKIIPHEPQHRYETARDLLFLPTERA